MWWRQWWGYEAVLWHNWWEIARPLAAIACECPFAKHQVSKVISVYVCACLHTTQTGWDPTKFSVMQVFKNIIDRLHHCNHRRSLPNVFRLDKVSKLGQGDFNFSSHQQSVQNFKLEAASLMANSHAHIYFYKDWQRENKVFKTSNWKQLLLWPMAKDFCATSMTKGKLFSLEMHFKQAIWE